MPTKIGKITCEEVAKIMDCGISAQQVRYAMRAEKLNIGWAQLNEGKQNWGYYIIPARLCRYLRITEEELQNRLNEIRQKKVA